MEKLILMLMALFFVLHQASDVNLFPEVRTSHLVCSEVLAQ